MTWGGGFIREQLERARALGGDHGLGAQLIRGGLGSVAIRVGNIGLTIGLSVLLARLLGPEGYGVYTYALAIVTLIAIPAQFGIPTLVVREVATYQVQERWSLFRGVLRRSNQAILVLSASLVAAAGLVASLLSDAVPTDRLHTLGWALLLPPFVALGNLRGATLRGLRRIVQGQLPEQILRPGLVALLVALAAFATAELGPETAMALRVAAAAATFLISAWLLRRALPHELDTAQPNYETQRWLSSALPLGFVASAGMIQKNTDVLMLGYFTGAEEVGVYRVTVAGSTLVAFALTAVNLVVAPHFARMYAEKDLARLQRLATTTARAALSAALPVTLAFVLAGDHVLRVVFGAEFTHGHADLAVLCLGQLVNAGVGSVGLLLNMSGHELDTAKGLAVSAAANVALNAILIPPFGMEGAAVATATTVAGWNLLLWRRVLERTGVDTTAFGRRARSVN